MKGMTELNNTNGLPTYSEARTILLERAAARLGKMANELVPWDDYDPIAVDEAALHMSRGHSGVRWTGD
ncbi:MAG: hypothetical protein NNA22_11270 [Nitrospira sp.]|nr:hypothetical protein [Nitrospira sp.]